MTLIGALFTAGWFLEGFEHPVLSFASLALIAIHFGLARPQVHPSTSSAWPLITLVTFLVLEWWALHAVLMQSPPWLAGMSFCAVYLLLATRTFQEPAALPPGVHPGATKAMPLLLHSPGMRRLKRHCDLALTLPAILPVSILIGLLALAVRLQDGGPAFITQVRIGRGGRRFLCWKLRTMRVNAEQPGQPQWSERSDPRITRLGHVLRLSWLDELPQLWLVLKGELSLVGPRPERPVFVQAFTRPLPKYPQRHAVPAGLTGLAQVRGFTGASSIAGRLANDLRYVREWTPALDIFLILRTLQQMMAPASRPDPNGLDPQCDPEETQPSPPTPPSTST